MAQRIIINDPVAEALGRLSDQVIGQAVSSLNRLRAEEKSDARYEEQKAYRDEQRLANESLRELSAIASQLGEDSIGYEYDNVYKRAEKVKTRGSAMAESLKQITLENIDAKRRTYEIKTEQTGDLFKVIRELEDKVNPLDAEGSLKGGNTEGVGIKGVKESLRHIEHVMALNAKRYTGSTYKLLEERTNKLELLAGISQNIQTIDKNLDVGGIQYSNVAVTKQLVDLQLEGVVAALSQGDARSLVQAGDRLKGLSDFILTGRAAINKAQDKKLASMDEAKIQGAVEELRGMYDSLADLSAQLGPENDKARAIFNAPKSIELGQRNFYAMQTQLANQIGNILGHGNVNFSTLKKIGEDGKQLSPYTVALNNYNKDRSTANARALADELYEISKDPSFAARLQASPGFDKTGFNFRQDTEQTVAKTFLQRLTEAYGTAKGFAPGGGSSEATTAKPTTYDWLSKMIMELPDNLEDLNTK